MESATQAIDEVSSQFGASVEDLHNSKLCYSCNNEIRIADKFCRQCGMQLTMPVAAANPVSSRVRLPVLLRDRLGPPPVEQSTMCAEPSIAPHPWLRYWARTLDGALYFFVASFVIEFVIAVAEASGAFPDAVGRIVGKLFVQLFLSAVAWVSWWFIEAFNISAFGATLGKRMFGIKVCEPSGEKLSYRRALGRAVQVWIRGLYLGMPTISCFGQVKALMDLSKNGITPWDAKGGYRIEHKRIGPLRTTLCIALIIPISLVYWSMLIAANSPVQHYDDSPSKTSQKISK